MTPFAFHSNSFAHWGSSRTSIEAKFHNEFNFLRYFSSKTFKFEPNNAIFFPEDFFDCQFWWPTVLQSFGLVDHTLPFKKALNFIFFCKAKNKFMALFQKLVMGDQRNPTLLQKMEKSRFNLQGTVIVCYSLDIDLAL